MFVEAVEGENGLYSSELGLLNRHVGSKQICSLNLNLYSIGQERLVKDLIFYKNGIFWLASNPGFPFQIFSRSFWRKTEIEDGFCLTALEKNQFFSKAVRQNP